MTGSGRTTQTYEEYKAERRKQVLPPRGWRPLDDYVPQIATWLVSRRGTPPDWPFCRCGSAQCPDGDHMTPEEIGLMLGRARALQEAQDAA